MNIHTVADFFIAKPDRESGDLITHLKLQKLTYYSQAWHLAIYGNELFEPEFEAWIHGPVALNIFARFADFKYGSLSVDLIKDDIALSAMSPHAKDHLSEVWDVYGGYSAKALEELTHSEDPWKEARAGLGPLDRSSRIIPKERMKSYYGELLKSGQKESNT